MISIRIDGFLLPLFLFFSFLSCCCLGVGPDPAGIPASEGAILRDSGSGTLGPRRR